MALARNAAAAFIAEVTRQGWHPVLLVYVDWPSGAVRAHSGVGPIVFGSATWQGIGAYGRVEMPEEGRGGAARRTVLTLLGPTDSLMSQVQEQARGRDGEVWFGAVTEPAGNTLVADPVRLFRGTVDAMGYRATRQSAEGPVMIEAALQLTLVSGPPLRRNASQHHSLEDHKANFSATDTAGRLIQAAATNAANRTWPE